MYLRFMNQIKRTDLSLFLNTLFEVKKFKDYCPMGLVVEGSHDIQKVITGVSLSLKLIQQAIQLHADTIIVHHPHGFWDNQSKVITGAHKEKISLLLKHNINVYSFHLPMDAHPSIGNNAQIAQALSLNPYAGFAKHGGVELGLLCQTQTPLSISDLKQMIGEKIGSSVWLGDGPQTIYKIAICSGAAPSEIEELVQIGDIDAYVTGEARENTQSYCDENRIHFIAAGHHQTEVFGPRALAEHLRVQLNLNSTFINLPNPV